jgi:hypothetical protein
METKQDLKVAGTVNLKGEYPECESSMSFIAVNLYLTFEICAFWGILRSAEW